jgi:hypothetical protein
MDVLRNEIGNELSVLSQSTITRKQISPERW